ncbi:MAG: T9SS type A sorting domain-containing protein [Flavobacteriales bacterium]|jgi:hypothetical protein|nr:T9SS type A sorting domain-containing protein [Flavobacteriales bacterium]
MRLIGILFFLSFSFSIQAQNFIKHTLSNRSSGKVDFEITKTNSDSLLDIITLSNKIDKHLGWFEQNSNFFHYSAIENTPEFDLIETSYNPQNDSLLLVTYSSYDSTLHHYHQVNGGFTLSYIENLPWTIQNFFYQDFDNDGVQEFLFLPQNDSIQIHFANNNHLTLPILSDSIDKIRVFDYYEDSFPDIFIQTKNNKFFFFKNSFGTSFSKESFPTDTTKTIQSFDFYKQPDSLNHEIYLAYENTDTLSVFYKNNFNLSFHRNIISPSQNLQELIIKDFNNDSLADIVFKNKTMDSLFYISDFENNTNDTIIISKRILSLEKWISEDIDNDGYLDIVTLSERNGQLTIFKFQGGGFSEQIISKQTVLPLTHFVDIDFDNDLDIVCTDKIDTGRIVDDLMEIGIFENKGNDNFEYHFLIEDKVYHYPQKLYAKTIQKGNRMDIYYRSHTALLSFLIDVTNYDYVEKYFVYHSGLHSFNQVIEHDWDQDGDIDLHCYKYNSAVFYANNDSNYFHFGAYWSSKKIEEPNTFGIMDMNNDSIADIVTCDDRHNIMYYTPTTNNSLAKFSSTPDNTHQINKLGTHSYFWLKDYDFDGIRDCISLNTNQDSMFFYQNNGLGNFQNKEHINFPIGNFKAPSEVGFPHNIIIEDFDQDQDLDIIHLSMLYEDTLWNQYEIGYSFRVFLNNGANTFHSYKIDTLLPIVKPYYYRHIRQSLIHKPIAAKDYDNDGDIDLVGRWNGDLVYYENNICVSSHTIIDSICESYTSPSGNNIYYTSGTYIDIIPNHKGCDSIITLHLTRITSSDTLSISTCEGYLTKKGNFLSSSGVYSETFQNHLNCDSIVVYDLTILQNRDSFNIQECSEYTLPNGDIIEQSGLYIDSAINVNGCDSVSIFDIEITLPKIELIIENETLKITNPNITLDSLHWIDCVNKQVIKKNQDSFTPPKNRRYFCNFFKNNCVFSTDCIRLSEEAPSIESIGFHKNNFYILFEDNVDELEIEIIDILGRKALSYKGINVMDFESPKEFAKGVYIIHLNYHNKIRSFKFMNL